MDLYQEAKEIIIKAGEQVLERNGIEEIKEKKRKKCAMRKIADGGGVHSASR